MTYLFTCPHCSAQTHVEPEYLGQTGPCAVCGKQVTVPYESPDDSLDPDKPSGSSRALLYVAVGVSGLAGLFVTIVLLFSLLFPAIQSARQTSEKRRCGDNMTQILAALEAYHARYGSYPPAYLPDPQGKPMHSWRVLILPYLPGGNQVYSQYDFSEPWDSQNNIGLLSLMPAAYGCPSDPDSKDLFHTSYLVINGSKSAFQGSRPKSKVEFSDPLHETVLVVERSQSGVYWLEPKDLTYSQLSFQLSARSEDIGSLHPEGAYVGLANGEAVFLPQTALSEDVNAIVTISGNDAFDDSILDESQ